MKKIAFLLLFLSMGFVVVAQKNKDKKENTALQELVDSQQFRIESAWARPQGGSAVNAIAAAKLQPPGSSGNRISLIGNFNFLELDGDQVSAYLPYYGERQISGDHYSGKQAIEFDGEARELIIEKNEKKKSYDISFDVDNGTETFQVNIQLFKSMKSLLTVNSNQRFVIRYDGKVGELQEDKEEAGK